MPIAPSSSVMPNVNSDAAYEYVKSRILSGEYPPGRALVTNVLAPEIGVSRTPLRDALRQLEAEGLVTILPRLGASVTKMDVTTFQESCDMRLALEAHAAGLAARFRSNLDLSEISAALDEMRRINQEMDSGAPAVRAIPALVRADVRFHLAIISAAKNELMKKEIMRLHLVNRVVTRPHGLDKQDPNSMKSTDAAHRQIVLKAHDEIYQAIAAGDSAKAKSAMETHIQDIIDRSVNALVRSSAALANRTQSEAEAIYQA